MSRRLAATLTSLALVCGTVTAALPAQAATSARENLIQAVEATAAANASGYSYSMLSTEAEPYTISSVGKGLGADAPQLDATWFGDESGIFAATVARTGGGALSYRSYREWRKFWAGGTTRSVRATVRDAVAKEKGSDESLLIEAKFTADSWQNEQRLFIWEPSMDVREAVYSMPADAQVVEETSSTGTVFSFELDSETMRVTTSADGLIDSYSLTNASGAVTRSVTMLARGSAVQLPDLAPLMLDTNVLLRADKYERDRNNLRRAVLSISETAKSLAKAAGSRVTKKVLAQAVKRAVLEPSTKVTRTTHGFTLSSRSNRSYADFGKLCADLRPGKFQPRVIYCRS